MVGGMMLACPQTGNLCGLFGVFATGPFAFSLAILIVGLALSPPATRFMVIQPMRQTAQWDDAQKLADSLGFGYAVSRLAKSRLSPGPTSAARWQRVEP